MAGFGSEDIRKIQSFGGKYDYTTGTGYWRDGSAITNPSELSGVSFGNDTLPGVGVSGSGYTPATVNTKMFDTVNTGSGNLGDDKGLASSLLTGWTDKGSYGNHYKLANGKVGTYRFGGDGEITMNQLKGEGATFADAQSKYGYSGTEKEWDGLKPNLSKSDGSTFGNVGTMDVVNGAIGIGQLGLGYANYLANKDAYKEQNRMNNENLTMAKDQLYVDGDRSKGTKNDARTNALFGVMGANR